MKTRPSSNNPQLNSQICVCAHACVCVYILKMIHEKNSKTTKTENYKRKKKKDKERKIIILGLQPKLTSLEGRHQKATEGARNWKDRLISQVKRLAT